MSKTFYIETFGCQMNVHDSEKVAGTLVAFGYRPVESPEEADLVLYNTCSIREKAAQKVFTRLNQFRKARTGGKIFGVLGCVGQQEGEKIFEAAPHVSLVVGSASYYRLPELLAQLERGERHVTGLSLDTDQTFDTEFTRRDNPFRAYITIIEGCDKHCAYCVVPFTRGPERSRTSQSVLGEARRLAEGGYTEIQLLGQNVNSYRDPSPARVSFAELLARVAEIPGIRRVRFTTSHPRDFTREIVEAIESHPKLCSHVHLPVQSGSSEVLRRMQREYSREQYLERIAWIRQSKRPISITTDIIVGFPGEREADFEQTLTLLDEVGYDSVFSFQYSPRPNTASLRLEDAVPEEEKGRRLRVLQERQKQIQLHRYEMFVGTVEEVLVEGRGGRESQWKGRTSHNIVLNFTVAEVQAGPVNLGDYWNVRITQAGPNSLVGEAVAGPVDSLGTPAAVAARPGPFSVLQ
ncbi:MAG: tRNA (N6-isopentenyl adenosine(37)-C2)-methylthiotransferase MiaB [Acidobacteria bacterium RIFCSPLOWO2_02_FULL_61_28]|nr:MAG: tRNA (N6-isopentenyl adenosine(37)-C2)-methylthiotransferase MiaB [Acidobacteria bacterium RIFCSPLOWO2_02_FULL_61_28]